VRAGRFVPRRISRPGCRVSTSFRAQCSLYRPCVLVGGQLVSWLSRLRAATQLYSTPVWPEGDKVAEGRVHGLRKASRNSSDESAYGFADEASGRPPQALNGRPNCCSNVRYQASNDCSCRADLGRQRSSNRAAGIRQATYSHLSLAPNHRPKISLV